MSQNNDIDLDSRGFSFRFLLLYNRKRPNDLLKFMPEEMRETLEHLEPGITNSSKIVDLIESINDPEAILSNPRTLEFAINLLPRVKAVELCKKIGLEVSRNPFDSILERINDTPTISKIKSFFGIIEEEIATGVYQPPQSSVATKYGMFEHQRQIAISATKMLQEHPHRCVLHMPTGSGKTRTAMHIVARHISSHDKAIVIWLSQNVELLEQAASEFELAWSYLGDRECSVVRYWGGNKIDLSKVHDGFVIAGFSKIVNWHSKSPSELVKFADRTSLVIVDEAHQAIAGTYRAVIDELVCKKPNTQLLGLTATPGRTWSDVSADRELSRFFEERKVALKVSGYANPVTYLIESGYLARPKFSRLRFEGSDTGHQQTLEAFSGGDKDFSGTVLNDLGGNAERNAMIIKACEELITRHDRILVFCPSVSSARMLTAILKTRGIECEFITAETPSNIRTQKISRYKGNSKKPIILFNFGVLTTGFDAPKTSALIIARPTVSLVLYSQMVGRAIRGTKAGGNASAEIVTIVDTSLPGFGNIAEAFFNWEDVWRSEDD